MKQTSIFLRLKLKARLWCLLPCLFALLSANAQGWLRYFDNSNSYWECRAIALPNDDVASLSHGGFDTLRLRRWDAEGNIQWQQTWRMNYSVFYSNVFHSPGQGFTVYAGLQSGTSLSEIPFFSRINDAGQVLWTKQMPEFVGTNIAVAQLQDGGFFVAQGKADSLVFIRYNSNLETLQRKAFSFGDIGDLTTFTDIAATADALCIGYRKQVPTGGWTYGLLGASWGCDLLWDNSFQSTPEKVVNRIKASPSGDFYVLLQIASVPELHKISNTGQDVWVQAIPVPAQAADVALAATADSGAVWSVSDVNTKKTQFLRTSPDGSLLWAHETSFLEDVEWPKDMAETADGALYQISRSLLVSQNLWRARLLKFSGTGEFHLAHAIGRVFHDAQADCAYDTGEKPLSGWVVSAEKQGATITSYALTDSLGRYEMTLDTGSYLYKFRLPNNYWQSDCVALLQTVQFPTPSDTVLVDLPLAKGENCPLLEVDLGTPFLRRCYESTYYVRYANTGTADAQNAYVDIYLDPYLSLQYSTILGSQLPNNIWRFPIGDVAWGESGRFNLRVLVNCDSTVLGQTHCSAAYIFPDTICFPMNSSSDSTKKSS